MTCAVEHLAWVNVTEPTIHVNGDHAQYLDHTFRCRYLDGTPHPADDESIDVQWFPATNLPTMKPILHERIMTAINHDGHVRLA